VWSRFRPRSRRCCPEGCCRSLLIYLPNPRDLAEAWDNLQIFVAAPGLPTYTRCNLREVILERIREGRLYARPTEGQARFASNRRGPEVLAAETRARGTVPSRAREAPSTSAAVTEKRRAILASKGLTLYRASQQSIALYGRSSPYFVPHNLYYDLRSGSFRPSVHQIFALSRVSGYRVADWLRVLGFDLEDITRLQILLPSKRTIVLDTSLTDPNDWVPWLRNRPPSEPIPSIARLARLVELGRRRRIASVSQLDRHFVYAKVGTEDAFAFPDLLPGSIVRVNPEIAANLAVRENSSISDHVFLVEHSNGFFCCRVRILGGGVIVPFDNGFSYAQVELPYPQEARLWGAVDLDFRSLLRGEAPDVPRDLDRHRHLNPFLHTKTLGNCSRERAEE
jgi:hypothetical protein